MATVKNLVYKEKKVLMHISIYSPEFMTELLEISRGEYLNQSIHYNNTHLQLLSKELGSFFLAVH